MINRKQAKKLIDKYLNDECSPVEKELLDQYLDSFQDKGRLWSELRFDEEIKQKLLLKIKAHTLPDGTSNRKISPFKEILKYAAILIGVAIGFYIWQTYDHTGKENPQLVIEDDAIILKTGDNVAKEIDLSGKGEIINNDGSAIASQDKGKIAYKQADDLKELVYNEIIVPKGKTFELVLSDGTLVHLNSQTALKFPINFIKGQERKVFLDGEAYFEVAKDAQHPFSVEANNINVRVLGTHFAVNSYLGTEDYAVLVEGSVAVNDQNGNEGHETIIEPGQKASLEANGIKVRNVDVADYLGWRTGILMFNNEPFSDIIKKIERKYNVAINNSYTELAGVRFYGKFDDETIVDLLDTFKESAGFEYEITNNKVVIKKPI